MINFLFNDVEIKIEATIYAVCHEEDTHAQLLTENELIKKAQALYKENNEKEFNKYVFPKTKFEAQNYLSRVYGINSYIIE